jgi:formylglycine-generating enzyme required for sulfatase activity
MEWLDGVTLREILDRRKMQNRQFSLVEADNIISQLSEALHYAHAYTVHRDIKPENVLVESGRGDIHSDLSKAKIKLTDFGIAKMLGPSRFTMTSMQMGTPYYMAPEQKTDAGKVDKRADIYAAGVVLFELLTFQNSIGPEMPSEINPNLPQEIDDVYKKAVATNPEKRYSGIKDLSDDINKIVAVEKQRLEEEREKAEEAKRREIEKQKQAEERRRMEGEEKERQEVEKQRQEQGRIRREAEEHKQREKKEKERQEKVEVERKEKEACVVRIGGRKRKKRKMYERKYASPNLAIIIPAGVCAVIGIAVAIMFGMGGDSKSTYRENPPSGTSTYTKPTETGHKENVSTYSKPVETRQGNYNYVEMVLVRGGSFNMGDTFGDKYKDEKPMHNVTVGDFYIGRYEVTQGEWEDVMGNNLSRFKNGHNYPVERVRWDDVQVFIGELNQRTGKKYRLPTEAEWEYAAKSGGKREEWSGTSSESLLGQYAWYDANSGDKTHPVGQKMPNGLGIYDMTGNVWEWCQDIYSEKAYSKHQRSNPIYTGNGSYRVIRGGSWGSGPGGLRAARRNSRPRDSRNHLLGFRLARTP